MATHLPLITKLVNKDLLSIGAQSQPACWEWLSIINLMWWKMEYHFQQKHRH